MSSSIACRHGSSHRRPLPPSATLRHVGRFVLPGALAAACLLGEASAQSSSIASFCSGDGTATPCPCGNVGASGAGCANSIDANGARLTAVGNPYVDADTFRLVVTGLPPSPPVFYRQATDPSNGGMGVAFGDGLLCFSGSLIRLGTRTATSGASSFGFGNQADPLISVRGLIPGPGTMRVYQATYRNAQPFCTPDTNNTTNALAVVWGAAPAQPLPSLSFGGGEFYVPELPWDNTGVTYDWDAAHMSWSPRRRLFTDQPVQFADNPSWRLQFDAFASASSRMSESSFGLSASTSIGRLDAAVDLATQSTTAQSDLSTSFTLGVAVEHARSMLDPLAGLHMVDDADTILKLPEPQRSLAWSAAGFGSYVAMGHANRGLVSVRVTLTDATRAQSRARFFEFNGTYATTSGSVAMAELVNQARQSTGIHVDAYSEGLPSGTSFSLPQPGQISTVDDQIHWSRDVVELALSASQKQGLYLAPVRITLQDPPSAMPLAWAQALMLEAASQATEALADLHLARRWASPITLRHFLGARNMPGSSESLDEARARTTTAVSMAMSSLQAAVQDYTEADHSLLESYRDAVLDAIVTLADARRDLGYVITAIHAAADALPSMTVSVHEDYTPGNHTTYDNWVPFVITVDNAAFFYDNTVPGLLEYLQSYDVMRGHGVVMMYDKEEHWGGQNIQRNSGNGGAANFSIDSIESLTGNGRDGLKRVVFRCSGLHRDDVRDVKLTITDSLDRFKTTPIDLAAAN